MTALLAMTWPCAAQEATARRYSLKQEEPSLGSHVLRDVASGSRVQLDKPFLELPETEQAFWRSQYEDLGPTDIPPFPARGLKTLYKAMYTVQRKHQVRGNLTMFVQIDKTGRATSIAVLASPDPFVAKDVAAILMLEEYTPGVCAGVSCAMDFPFRITFELR